MASPVPVAASAAASQASAAASSAGWFDPGSLSFELVKGAPAAVVALIIGFIATWVAFQQLRVGRAKLNLDLFEQRYALYELLWAFMSARVGDIEDVESVTRELRNSLPKFYFLFGPEIGDYVSAVLTRGTQQDAASSASRFPLRAESAQKAMRESSGHTNWFFDETNSLRERFSGYLDFKAWR